jgi:hypothetical protein
LRELKKARDMTIGERAETGRSMTTITVFPVTSNLIAGKLFFCSRPPRPEAEKPLDAAAIFSFNTRHETDHRHLYP